MADTKVMFMAKMSTKAIIRDADATIAVTVMIAALGRLLGAMLLLALILLRLPL
jgi:hypothetical protein